jgi:hypothetical protein
MADLRKPPFILALVLILLAVLLESGTGLFLRSAPHAPPGLGATAPGYGIPFMALIDGLILFTVALMGSSRLLGDALQGRIQGILTLIVALVVLIVSIVLIMGALLLLALMICLLVAVPFGTLVYMVVYGHFDRSGAQVILSLLMLIKLGFAACLLLAQGEFAQNKGLVLIVLCSLIAQVVTSFLHGFVPLPLVSITDAVAGIIAAIIAAIWSIFFLVNSLRSVFRALRFNRGVA